MTTTHTYSVLQIGQKAYNEIFKALKDAGYEHAIDAETGVIDMAGIALDTEAKQYQTVDWCELSRSGIVERINREITHPMGLAVFYDPDTGVSGGAMVAPDGAWQYPEDIRDDEPIPTPRTAEDIVSTIFAMLPGGKEGYLTKWGTIHFAQAAARVNASLLPEKTNVTPDVSRIR